MREVSIKNNVKSYLKGQQYFVPEKEFNIGVRPDVVALRWENDYEIEAIAVECKATTNIRSIVETGLTQAREYQLSSPYVYLATPKLQSYGELKAVLESLRMGLHMVDDKTKEVVEAKISSRLDYDEFLFKVRQVAAAILTYKEVVGHINISIPYPGEVHCYQKDVPANFLLSNYPKDRDYYFGICIEQRSNVKQIFEKISKERFYKLFANLPQEYLINLDYIDTYKPREVSWSILRMSVQSLSKEDVERLVNHCREKNWKTRIVLWKKVWREDEVLSKKEHKKRVETVREELAPVRELVIGR